MKQGMMMTALFILGGCGQTLPAHPDAGLDADAQQGADTNSSQDPSANDDIQPTGGLVRFSAKATQHCPVDPPVSPGLSVITPTASRAGILKVELLRTREDPFPVPVAQSSTLVELDLETGGIMAEGQVMSGTYRFVRIFLAYGSVTVPAMAHVGSMSVPGALEFNVATATHQDSSNRQRAAGELVARFSAFGMGFDYIASAPLDCPLSESGGLIETGDSYRITIPVPGGVLNVAESGAAQELLVQFPLAGAVTWIELTGAGFAPGVLDIQATPQGSETPARLPICDLFLSDRCEQEAKPVRHAPAWPMPDSATTTCTNGHEIVTCPAPGSPGAGQDGSYAVNPTNYRLDGDTVRDLITGLLWQRTPSPEALDWWEARAYCDELNLDGRDDWSLPSRLELVSLLDLGRFGPSIDLVAFPDAPSDFFWSASPALFSSLAFGVRFDQGFVYDHDPRVSGRVRCVTDGRSGPADRLQIQGDTVYDAATGLMWQRQTLPPASWLDALAACQNLGLGGATDWRLPTLKELLTIVEETALNPSTDIAAFPDTPAQWLWAASPGLAPPDYGWTVSFTDGFCTPGAVTELYLSRCVRNHPGNLPSSQ